MEKYVVLYKEADQKVSEDPLCFICSAEDMEHAEEKCIKEHPNCDIVWAVRFDAESYHKAPITKPSYTMKELVPYLILMR